MEDYEDVIELQRVRIDKETNEKTVIPYNIAYRHINCLYQNKFGVFLVDTQGRMANMPYTLNELEGLVKR